MARNHLIVVQGKLSNLHFFITISFMTIVIAVITLLKFIILIKDLTALLLFIVYFYLILNLSNFYQFYFELVH